MTFILIFYLSLHLTILLRFLNADGPNLNRKCCCFIIQCLHVASQTICENVGTRDDNSWGSKITDGSSLHLARFYKKTIDPIPKRAVTDCVRAEVQVQVQVRVQAWWSS